MNTLPILHRSTIASLVVAAMTMAPSYALSEVKGKAAEQAGAILFRDKGCAYCHGPAGQGTAKGPSLADLRKTWTAPRVTAQIQNGGQKMPAFGDSLTHDEVQQLVAYLRAKHPHTPPPAPTSAPMINPGQ